VPNAAEGAVLAETDGAADMAPPEDGVDETEGAGISALTANASEAMKIAKTAMANVFFSIFPPHQLHYFSSSVTVSLYYFVRSIHWRVPCNMAHY
jgi:hypothetical protein